MQQIVILLLSVNSVLQRRHLVDQRHIVLLLRRQLLLQRSQLESQRSDILVLLRTAYIGSAVLGGCMCLSGLGGAFGRVR